MTYEVSTIPIPLPAGRPPLYPWRDLAVGETFFVPAAKRGRRASLANMAYATGRRLGMKFSARTVLEDGEWGIRFWRRS
jgi:hypothetical protein